MNIQFLQQLSEYASHFDAIDTLFMLWGLYQIARLLEYVHLYAHYPFKKFKGDMFFAWAWIVLVSLFVSLPWGMDLPVWLTAVKLVAIPAFALGAAAGLTWITVKILGSPTIYAASHRVKVPLLVRFALTIGSNIVTLIVALVILGTQWSVVIPLVWAGVLFVAWRELEEGRVYPLHVYHLVHDFLLIAATFAAVFISPWAMMGYIILLAIDFKVAGHLLP